MWGPQAPEHPADGGPGPSGKAGSEMTRGLIALALVLVPVWAWGQGTVLNPKRAEFTVSPDHAEVVRYELRIFLASGSVAPIRTDDLGKPTPDAQGTVSVPFPPFPQDPGVIYVAKVIAIGADGEGVSLPSNDFLFAQGAELTLAQKVKLNWNAVGAAGLPVPWPANQAITWTVEGASAGNNLGTFETVPLPGGGFEPAAVWFMPAKAGTFTVQTSTVYAEQVHLFKLALVIK